MFFSLNDSSWTVVKEIVREEGVQGLFRGLTSTWAREVPGYFFFFGGYAASRKLLTPAGGNSDDLSESGTLSLLYNIVFVPFYTLYNYTM